MFPSPLLLLIVVFEDEVDEKEEDGGEGVGDRRLVGSSVGVCMDEEAAEEERVEIDEAALPVVVEEEGTMADGAALCTVVVESCC